MLDRLEEKRDTAGYEREEEVVEEEVVEEVVVEKEKERRANILEELKVKQASTKTQGGQSDSDSNNSGVVTLNGRKAGDVDRKSTVVIDIEQRSTSEKQAKMLQELKSKRSMTKGIDNGEDEGDNPN